MLEEQKTPNEPEEKNEEKEPQVKPKKSKKKHLLWIIPCLLLFFFVVFIVLPIVGFLSVMNGEDVQTGQFNEIIVKNGNPEEKIVQLKISGAIGETSTSFFETGSTFNNTLAQIQQIKEDPTVKAVVIEIDSPGGTVSASDKLYREVLELKELGKKVVVSMGDTAASGGYYIAAPADKIYAMPYTLTGSLGVIMTLPNYGKLAEKIGYEEVVIKSGAMKDIGSSSREMTTEERAVLQSYVDESYDTFVEIIVSGRNLPEETVRTLADGRIYSGKQALRHGLVDELGDVDAAIEGASALIGSEEPEVVMYEELPVTFAELLFSAKQTIADPFGTKAMLHPSSGSLQYLWKN